jgi:hypothetical protein
MESSRSDEFSTGLGNRPHFRRKVTGKVHGELSYDLENADDQGYTLEGQHLQVHDPKRALSTLENRADILHDQADYGERGARSTANAYGRLIGQVREHYRGSRDT